MPHAVFRRYFGARPFASALLVSALVGAPALAQSDRRGDDRTAQESKAESSRAESARPERRWTGPPAHQLLDRVDARIAQMKADLRLSAEQSQHWEGLRQALHDIAAARIERLTTPRRPSAAQTPAPQAQTQTAPAAPAAPEAPTGQSDRPSPSSPASPTAGSAQRADRPAADMDDEDDARAGADEDRQARRYDDRSRRRRDVERSGRDEAGDPLESMIEMASNMRGRADEMQKIAEAARPLYDTLDRRQQRLLTRFVQRDWIMSGVNIPDDMNIPDGMGRR